MTNCGSQPLLDANVASIGFSAGREGGKEGEREEGRMWYSENSSKRMPSRRIRKWRTGNRKYF